MQYNTSVSLNWCVSIDNPIFKALPLQMYECCENDLRATKINNNLRTGRIRKGDNSPLGRMTPVSNCKWTHGDFEMP